MVREKQLTFRGVLITVAL